MFNKYDMKVSEMGGACSRMRRGRVVYRVLVRKPEGKSPLGRPMRRWDDNVKMDLQGVGCEIWTGSS